METTVETKRYLIADQYNCPVHSHGYSPKKRRCSCTYFWTENPEAKVQIVATSEDSKETRDMKCDRYENGN